MAAEVPAAPDALEDVVMADKREMGLLSRRLWENVFSEDTTAFLDYYDSYVADHNRIYGQIEKGEMVSMLHMNPYLVQVGKKQTNVSYIVAVATKESCRHQGRMRRLLHTALKDARKRSEPFAFLMPASEDIYKPFGFRSAAWQRVIHAGSVLTGSERADHEDAAMICRPATKEDIPALVSFSRRVLRRHCVVYTVRDEAYYERIWEEQRAVGGGILLFYLGPQESFCGYCFTGTEDGPEAWELVISDEEGVGVPNETLSTKAKTIGWQERYAMAVAAVTSYFARKGSVKISGLLPRAQVAGVSADQMVYRPITMMRIVHLPEFMHLLQAKELVDIRFRIRDDFLPENEGIWHLKADAKDTVMERIAESDSFHEAPSAAEEFPAIPIEDLTEAVFGIRSIKGFPAEKFESLRDVYLNELV